MQLKRITLVNWSLYEPIDIDVSGSVAFVGENGAGKSSLLDAIQVVLFGGNQNKISLNAATTDGKIHNDRSIKAYCQGVFSTESSEENGYKNLRKRDDTYSYLALSFEHPDRGFVNLIVGIEIRASESNIKTPILLVMTAPRSISIDDFGYTDEITGFHTFNTKEVMDQLRLYQKNSKEIVNLEEGRSSTDYVGLVSKALSPSGLGKQIDPTRLSKILSQSMRLKSLSNVSTFVREFILSPSILETERIRSQQHHYNQLVIEIENIEHQIEKLNLLSKGAKSIISMEKKRLSYKWGVYEKQYDICVSDQDDLTHEIKEKSDEKGKKEKQLNDARTFVEEAGSSIKSLQAKVDENDSQKEFNELEAEKVGIEEKRQKNSTHESNLLALMRRVKGQDFQVLGLREPFELAERIEGYVSDISTRLNADEPFQKLISMLPEIKSQADLLYGKYSAKAHTYDEEHKKHEKNIKNPPALSPLKQATINLIAVLKEHGIEAIPLCHLAHINNNDWQQAIEALIGGDSEALVVSVEDEERAYRIYRQVKHNQAVDGVNIIKAKRIQTVEIREIEGTAAEFIESDNELALKYLQYKLQRHERVATELELKNKKFALTRDGMVSNDTSVKSLRLSKVRKFTQDQSCNVEEWSGLSKTAKAKYDHYSELKERMANIQSFCLLINAAFENGETIKSFSQFKDNEQGYVKRLKEIDDLISNLDLDYVSSLLSQIDSLNNQLKPYKATIENYPEEIIRLSVEIESKVQKVSDLDDQMTEIRNHQGELEDEFYYDSEFNDAVQEKIKDDSVDSLLKEIDRLQKSTIENFSDYKANLNASIVSMDNFPTIQNFNLQENIQLSDLNRLIVAEIQDLEGNELKKHRGSAEKAKEDIVRMFREDIIANLQGKFDEMQREIKRLNIQLQDKVLHGQTYSLTFRAETGYQELVNYIKNSRNQETDFVGGLFDRIPDNVLEIINDMVDTGSGNDYRQYFNYEFVMKDVKTGKRSDLSRRLKSGSGGERQSPLYIAISASLSSAWHSSKGSDGGALALLDEAFKDLDSANLNSAIQFMKDVGLQMIFAAPEDKEFTFRDSGVDTIIYLTKDEQTIDVDVDILGAKAQKLSEQNPLVNEGLMRSLVQSQLAKTESNHVAQ